MGYLTYKIEVVSIWWLQKDVIEKMINKMLEEGVIRNSFSPYANPMVLVKKKDDT